MDKPLACFEISSKSVKLLAGYQLDNNPIILYSKEEPIDGLIVDGRIADKEGLISVLKSFKNIDDPDKKIKISITEIYLVLPSLGFTVYQNNKSTNVVSSEGIVANIDIMNVFSLVNKERIPSGNSIVDIIPDEFILDNGVVTKKVPIGERSNSITIKAKIHALPSDITSSYLPIMNDAGYRIKRSAVSSFCYADLLAQYPELPKTYILVDIGARITTISFIGEGNAYSSLFFLKGGDDLSETIAQDYSIDLKTANSLKEDYGYDSNSHAFNPPIFKGNDTFGNPVKINQSDLNDIIAGFNEDYSMMLRNSIESLLKPYGNRFNSLPILLVGGGSMLNGLTDLLAEEFPDKTFTIVRNKTVGCSSSSYTALLGLINVVSSFRGSLSDNQHGVRNVSRVSENKKPDLNRNDDEI